MRKSQAWFRSNAVQDVMTRGSTLITMSTSSRSSYSAKKQAKEVPVPFVAGETEVGGKEVAGV